MIDNILFLGTPEFSIPTLTQLNKNYPSSVSVISMPDKPQGRGKKLSPSPVSQFATKNQLPLYQPKTKPELTQQIKELNPDIIIVIAYGMIIEKEITDHFNCFNIHSSLLPKYRGASPIHTCLLNGDKTTGITIIRMNEKMDEGDMVFKKEIDIENNHNLKTLSQKLAQYGADSCLEFIKTHYLTNNISTEPQNHAFASYTKKIQSSDLLITKNDSSELIYNKIKAFSPKPGAYILQDSKRVKLIEATFANGNLTLNKVQPEGKPIMNYTDYCLGHQGIQLW